MPVQDYRHIHGVDFGNFKTFAFSTIDENNRKLETVINECIENELTKKGLTVDIAKRIY